MKKDKWNLLKLRNNYKSGTVKPYLKFLHYIIIILMIAILITSMLHTMSLHILNSNFNWFNIFDANLKFKPKPLSEVVHILDKLNSSDFDIKSLTQTESKFIYQDDQYINLDDLRFLIEMEVDKTKTLWKPETISTYLFKYPEISEAISIIWLMMTIIYQCGDRESNWGIPQGWRIVVPSIFVFLIMAILSTIMAVAGNRWLNNFCIELKKEFQNPELIRCGLAIAHFRLQRQSHEFIFDTILNIYRHMNYAKAFCWTLAFTVILLRFLFAIDFQLIELKMLQYDQPDLKPRVFSSDSFNPRSADAELMKNSASYESDNLSEWEVTEEMVTLKDEKNKNLKSNENTTDNNQPKMFDSNKSRNYEDDDEAEDFQSANSILVRTPLMGSGEYVDYVK